MNKSWRVGVSVSGLVTVTVNAKDEGQAQQLAEELVADRLPTGFNGDVYARPTTVRKTPPALRPPTPRRRTRVRA